MLLKSKYDKLWLSRLEMFLVIVMVRTGVREVYLFEFGWWKILGDQQLQLQFRLQEIACVRTNFIVFCTKLTKRRPSTLFLGAPASGLDRGHLGEHFAVLKRAKKKAGDCGVRTHAVSQ
jgi:hypothetical protein